MLYNSAANYSLTLRVTDGAGLFDTAAVLVSIVDTNDAAAWVGTYLPSGAAAPTTAAYGPPTPQLSVSEAAPVGTVFGRVLATDANRGAVWGARIYALVASADARFFAINATSGELRVGAAGAAFWDQPAFFLVVTVQDADPVAPLVVPYNVSVQLVQVNTVAVTGYAVPNSTSTLAALNASGAAASLLYSGAVTPTLDVLVTTRGFASLLVLGGGFGRTAARLAREGVALTPAGIAAATPITASLGAWNQPPAAWAPVACAVTVPNSVLTCALPPGTAANLSLAISVAGWPAASPRTISYMPPSITAAASVSGLPLLTEGSDSVTLQGDNFGPVGTAPLVSYAPNASALPLLYAPPTPCAVTVAHTTMVCPTLPGVGSGLVFSVAVAGQAAVPGVFRPSPPVRYRTPAITAVAAPVLQTAGGEAAAIELNGAWEEQVGCFTVSRVHDSPPPHPPAGTQFGPYALPDGSSAAIFVQYCANFSAADALATALTGAPLYSSSLDPGLLPAGVPPVFTARGCSIDPVFPQTAIRCTSAAGVGAGLSARVTVAGLTSPVFAAGLAYEAPTVTTVGGAGADLCPTEGGVTVSLVGSQFGPLTPLDASGRPLPGNALQPLAWYGPNGTHRYAALSCLVRVADTQIDCLTAPGTGTGHLWTVSVGGQASPVMASRPTSYHPPIVSIEDGPGAVNAQTYGGEAVVIEGREWGAESVLQHAGE